MPSKTVADLEKVGSMVAASVRENEEQIAKKLAAWMGLAPEATKALLAAAASKLETSVAAAIAADHAHLAELGDDHPARLRRDDAATDLQTVLVELRDIVTVAFGEKAAAALGFEGRTPVDETMLKSLGTMVSNRLAEWTPPTTSRFEGYVFPKDVWAQKLSEPLVRLGTALTEVSKEKREAEASQVAKNRAVEESERALAFTAEILGALLEAIGEHEVAGKVRPARRRSSRGGATAETAEAPAATSPAVSE